MRSRFGRTPCPGTADIAEPVESVALYALDADAAECLRDPLGRAVE